MKERLQKILARAGICSRRKAEELIVSGKVRVNGKVVKELGSEADPFSDRIEALGETVKPEKKRWFLFYKRTASLLRWLIRKEEGRSWITSGTSGKEYSL